MPAQFALNAIALRRLKIARINELNDPFDFLSADLTDPEFRQAMLRTKEQLSADGGVICFSAAWESPLIWSHYAESHRGMCLGFDVPNEKLTAVRYQSQRIVVAPDRYKGEFKLTEMDMIDFISTKYVGWEYEKEQRVFVKLDHTTREHGLYFKDFDGDLVLREVILGVRCEIQEPVLRRAISTLGDEVTLVSTTLADGGFDVVAKDALGRGSAIG